MAGVSDSNITGDFEKHVDEALQTPRASTAVDLRDVDVDVMSFESEAQQMLERMDNMLHIVKNIKEQPDPSHRLEV